jgi:hypothetical protein
MCDTKAPAIGKRLTTASGVIYYPNTPEGEAAAKEDRNKNMGPGAEEEHHAPAEQPPFDSTDCKTYTDAQWDTGCSKLFKYSHMGIKPNGGGVGPGEVACNWQKLCENILDKVKAQFPALYISSGFRPGKGQSDHGYGRAADIQILGPNKVEMSKQIFKFIGSNGLPYSQLLFEGNWVHVAYGGGSNAASAIGIARDGANFSSWHQRSGAGLPSDLKWA